MVKNCKERREEIKTLIQEVGTWNINQTALARKYGVSVPMIGKDLKKIASEIDLKDLQGIKLNLHMGYRKAVKEAFAEASRSSGKNKMDALKTFNQVAEGFTKFLESYGFKEKIADKVLIEESDEELKKLQKIVREIEKKK